MVEPTAEKILMVAVWTQHARAPVGWMCVLPHSDLKELVTCNSPPLPPNSSQMHDMLSQYTNMVAKLDTEELLKILDDFY